MNGAITSRVPADEYFALPGVSISRLKELKRSPLHYRYRMAVPKESTPLRLGKAAHCAVLEPERYATEFAVWARRTESGNLAPRNSKYWEGFKLEHAGREIITEDEHLAAQAISRAVRGSALAMTYLATGDPEVTLQWSLPPFECRGRVDWLTRIDNQAALVGLKTARDCRHFQFGSAAARMGYHLQWAFYYDGYLSITGEKPRMVEIVVESEAPHAVAVYRIPDDIIEQGREEYMALLDVLAECAGDDKWPGPYTEEQFLTLPSWVYGQQDEDLTELGLEK